MPDWWMEICAPYCLERTPTPTPDYGGFPTWTPTPMSGTATITATATPTVTVTPTTTATPTPTPTPAVSMTLTAAVDGVLLPQNSYGFGHNFTAWRSGDIISYTFYIETDGVVNVSDDLVKLYHFSIYIGHETPDLLGLSYTCSGTGSGAHGLGAVSSTNEALKLCESLDTKNMDCSYTAQCAITVNNPSGGLGDGYDHPIYSFGRVDAKYSSRDKDIDGNWLWSSSDPSATPTPTPTPSATPTPIIQLTPTPSATIPISCTLPWPSQNITTPWDIVKQNPVADCSRIVPNFAITNPLPSLINVPSIGFRPVDICRTEVTLPSFHAVMPLYPDWLPDWPMLLAWTVGLVIAGWIWRQMGG